MPTTLHVVESMLCSPYLPPYTYVDLHIDFLETFGENDHSPRLQLLESMLQ
jgi:hypothetical protein